MIRILVIEDEIIIARFIERTLKSHFSCEVDIAISIKEARETMTQLLPHLVLCDINLKSCTSGLQVVQEFRQHYNFEVIYITSYQAKNIIEEALASGAVNYLIKPIDEMQLYAGVRLAVNRILERCDQLDNELNMLLTNSQRRILRLVSIRKSTIEIAGMLKLSRHTVKNQRHKICQKLGLNDENNALLKWALEHASSL